MPRKASVRSNRSSVMPIQRRRSASSTTPNISFPLRYSARTSRVRRTLPTGFRAGSVTSTGRPCRTNRRCRSVARRRSRNLPSCAGSPSRIRNSITRFDGQRVRVGEGGGVDYQGVERTRRACRSGAGGRGYYPVLAAPVLWRLQRSNADVTRGVDCGSGHGHKYLILLISGSGGALPPIPTSSERVLLSPVLLQGHRGIIQKLERTWLCPLPSGSRGLCRRFYQGFSCAVRGT